MVTVPKSLSNVQDISTDVFLKLFDAQILLYCSEIWEMENCHILENVHLILSAPIFTPNVMIYGKPDGMNYG